MPSAALRACIGSPTCPHPATYKGRCADHAKQIEQARYNVDTRKWYSTEGWRALRQIVLAEHDTCQVCRSAPSTEVDHLIPHRGSFDRFWDRDNLQGLCATCHGQKTRRGL